MGDELEVLAPQDWFVRGHDLLGGDYDEKKFWHHHTKPGIFLWHPPPAAAEVALEELRVARIKRQDSLHVFVCPRLFTSEWLKQLQKAADFLVEVPVGNHFWPREMHEPLKLAFCFPYLDSKPWQVRSTPKMCAVARGLRDMFKDPRMDARDFLCKFLLEIKRLRTLPPNVVRRVLYFESVDKVPQECDGQGSRKRARRSSKVGCQMGKKRRKGGQL